MQRFVVIPAVHVLFLRRDRVLLARRCNTGYEDGSFSVPAGHLDGDETARTAAVREATEEIGVTVAPADVGFGHVMHRRADDGERIDFFFVVERWEGEPRITEPELCDELRWADPDRLPANTVRYVRAGIERTLAGQPFSEFGW
jgi:ADP-ribose pyrophosphatase YjhB (NUDIX family)